MRRQWMEQLRRMVLELSDRGKKEISTLGLCAAVGAEGVEAKAKVRRAVNHMVRRGELTRMSSGVFCVERTRIREAERYGQGYKRMWKIIRTERAGWTIANVAGTTGLHTSTVSEYCNWLLAQGFVVRSGKRGTAALYRATEKAAQHPATPFPPVKADRYGAERDAAARLARLFMEPSLKAHQDKILEECRIILARFGNRDENSENQSVNIRTEEA